MENKVDYLAYGDPDGKIIIYFHGAPGSPEECSTFENHAKKYRLNIICFDRFSIDSALQNNDYYKYIANAIIEIADGEKVDLIVFSISCHAAIETSLYLKNNVRDLHLISSTAPLDAANFLDGMAGEMVFSLAMKHSSLFILLSYWQTVLAKMAPTALTAMLFASAKGEDKLL
ncbi:hypothetical protein AADZ91_06590 [Colwelliaceae bacterium 6441]